MTDLMPLIESSESSRARELLRAARADGPRRGSAQRTLLALGVGVAASSAVSAAGATGAAGALAVKASLPAIAAKWLLVGSLGGVALASSAALVFTPATPAKPAASAVVRRPTPPAPVAEVAPTPRPASEPVPALNPQPAPPSARASSTAPSAPSQPLLAPSQASFAAPEQSKVLRDLALLDRARVALKVGDTARALAELERYASEHETQILDREAELLRIDTLLQRGEKASAHSLIQSYLAAYPRDSHATRLRAQLLAP